MKEPDELSAATVLLLAQEKIRDPKYWCQGHLAVDAKGRTTSPRGCDAVRWCAAGALVAVAPLRFNNDVMEALNAAALRRFGSAHITVNDSFGHASVMEMYDIAIEETSHEKSR